MATLRPRCPTPTQRTRTSSACPRSAAGWAPSVKTWISARESCPTRARAVRTASPSRFGRSRQGEGEGEEGEQLQDQEGIPLETLEERRSLAVAERGLPEHEARHRGLPAAHLQEVQEKEGNGEGGHEQGEGLEEAHASRSPLSSRSTSSSTGVSVATR